MYNRVVLRSKLKVLFLSSCQVCNTCSFRELDKEEKIGFSHMISLLALIKTYGVGTQKNRLTETILLSTHNIGFGSQISNLGHEKRSLSRDLLVDSTLSFTQRHLEASAEVNFYPTF